MTLSALQAAKETLVLSGTLTNNVSLYFLAWSKTWNIINNCSGNGEVMCRIVGEATGVKIEKETSRKIFYDGTAIAYLIPDASSSNHGVAILSSATDSDDETTAARSKAVKNIEGRLHGSPILITASGFTQQKRAPKELLLSALGEVEALLDCREQVALLFEFQAAEAVALRR